MLKKEIRHLYTKEGEALTGREYDLYYPRPQLKRDSFLSLNGQWLLSYGKEEKIKINVPYPPESILSGVFKNMGKDPHLTYTRSFTLPKGFVRDRVILHFGAVDQVCTVFVNGDYVGKHVGGYNSFSFDITKYLKNGEDGCEGLENTLTVNVRDYLSNKVLPYGKQTYKRGGMWYTPVSGIWQSVWLESVADEYIKSIKIEVKDKSAKIFFLGITDGQLKLLTPEGEKEFPIENGISSFTLENPRFWSPDNPYLYHFTAETKCDRVESYLAFRTLEIKEINGIPRLCLNGEPYFFHAVLDQGYFSDGIFTPATPELYKQDILKMKELGFNTLRKHIKVEPEEFYYQCDRLGMIVFQDFVNNGSYSFIRDTALPTVLTKKFPQSLMMRTPQQKEGFIDGLKKTVKQLYNHPCVCYWTIFNEGWGQFDSDKMYDFLKELDSSRFVDSTSGWFKGKKSDVESLHIYFKPVTIEKSDKPIVLSEFGGYSYKIEKHSANLKKTYGYKLFSQGDEFVEGLKKLYLEEIVPLIPSGLCGAVYTQLSDVEDETNGLLTYDRRECKVDKETMLEIASQLKII